MAGLEGLDPGFAAAIQAMIAASGGKLYIESGYRSVEEQQTLWEKAVAKYGSPEAARNWVAPPGHSNHNRGMAVDLGGDVQLAHDLAPRFGLVFPMSWEPWHIEPVGARKNGSQDAYTSPPPGQENPATDPNLDAQPEFMAASLSDAMSALQDPTNVAAFADPTSPEATAARGAQGVMGPQGPGAQGPAGPIGPGDYRPGGQSGKGQIAPDQLYRALRAQGLPPDAAAALTGIAGRESGYDPAAYNGNAQTGDDSYGLFQINLLNGGWTDFLQAHGMKNPATSLRTVSGAVQAAKWIYDASGLQPWGGYKGEAWYHGGVDLEGAAAASGGEVSAGQLQGMG